MPPRCWPALAASPRPLVLTALGARDRATRPAAIWQTVLLAARNGDALDPLEHLDQVEQQAAGGGVGLLELDPHLVAEAEALAGALADQHLAAFVVAEELLAQAADGKQSVCSRTVERHEQAEPRHRRHPAGESRADMGRHIRRDIAIQGAAFGHHGAPLAHREMLAELLEAALVLLGQAAVAQP